LISGQYPNAQFVHIHRHPYNVVASLRRGNSFPEQEINAAVSFWYESLTIVQQFKLGFPDRIKEIAYEALVEDPQQELDKLLHFLGEEPMQLDLTTQTVHPEKNHYRETLSPEDIAYINEQCGALMEDYGYSRA